MRPETTDEAMRETMAGVYYRHEFARRNKHIVVESQRLLTMFPKTSRLYEHSSNYRQAKKVLTDYLREDIQSARADKSKIMKSQLSAFLCEYRIMPVPKLQKPFLSYSGEIPDEDEKKTPAQKDKSINIKDIYYEYFGIQRFEAFAIRELGMGHPVFLPVVLLGDTFSKWETAVKSLKSTGNSENHRHRFRMVLINDEISASTINNNITALRLYMTIRDSHFLKEFLDKRDKRRKRVDSYDQYLAAYDAAIIEGKSAKEAAKGVVEKHIPKKEWEDKYNDSGHAFEWVTKKFNEWQGKGSNLVLNYKLII